ncbi:helix-turn-helix domain-containing protein [Nocardia sp. NPDC002869]|uniref:helix-turn-helix domain-containing protein n=1 Tax=Nocardia sp. NPDC002869 TaxID=3161032 RepID=UPI00398CEF83
MNWLHTWLPPENAPENWTPGVAPQIMSAVWPLFLLLSVEVLSRVQWRPGITWMLARFGGVGAVAAGSAVISFGHVHDVLDSWGYGAAGSVVGPLVMDGLMVACGFALLSETSEPTPTNTQPATSTAPEVATAASAGNETRRDSARDTRTSHATPCDTTDTTPADAATACDSEPEADRDERIRQMGAAGKSTREIGREIGVSHSTVARVLARETPSNTPTGLTLITASANGQGTTA